MLRALIFLFLLGVACSSGGPSSDAGDDCPSDPAACSAAGVDCGEITVDARCVSCGGCTPPTTCGGGGAPNVCGCPALQCGDPDAECGVVVDDCGREMDCGGCAAGLACVAGTCGVAVGPLGDCSGPNAVCVANHECCPAGHDRVCLERPGGVCTPLPDLAPSLDATLTSTVIEDELFPRIGMFPNGQDCAVVEGCTVDGQRRLLRFDTHIRNVGTAPFEAGSPETRPTRFELSMCSGRYYYLDFVAYRVFRRNLDGSTGPEMLSGIKRSFCINDGRGGDLTVPDSAPDRIYNTCDHRDPQGISIGWESVLASWRECQWVDVTDLPRGEYLLELEVNPLRLIEELRYGNNTIQVPFVLN